MFNVSSKFRLCCYIRYAFIKDKRKQYSVTKDLKFLIKYI